MYSYHADSSNSACAQDLKWIRSNAKREYAGRIPLPLSSANPTRSRHVLTDKTRYHVYLWNVAKAQDYLRIRSWYYKSTQDAFTLYFSANPSISLLPYFHHSLCTFIDSRHEIPSRPHIKIQISCVNTNEDITSRFNWIRSIRSHNTHVALIAQYFANPNHSQYTLPAHFQPQNYEKHAVEGCWCSSGASFGAISEPFWSNLRSRHVHTSKSIYHAYVSTNIHLRIWFGSAQFEFKTAM